MLASPFQSMCCQPSESGFSESSRSWIAIVITMIAATQTFRVDGYVVDVLMRDLVGHDHSAAAFLVFMLIWRRTRGAAIRAAGARLSHRDIALEIGLSKSAVQQALRTLHRRGLVTSEQRHRTDVPEHRIVRLWAQRTLAR